MATKRVFPIFMTAEEKYKVQPKRKKGEPLKVWCWNVAGLRGAIKKGAAESIENSGADIVLLQETKCEEIPPEIMRMTVYPYQKLFPSKAKKGHAGVALLSRQKPLKCTLGFGDERFDKQGRFIHAEFEEFHVVGAYCPNSGDKLVNLPMRREWEIHVLETLTRLDKEKPVIYTGDMNVAHEEIDVRYPEKRTGCACFTLEERGDLTRLLEAGFVDVYRRLNPNKVAYSFWSWRHNAFGLDVGWRLDYYLISERIFAQVEDCQIHKEIRQSDHVPISLTIRI